jgi:hypothetical protein
LQDPSTYSVSGLTLTFSAAPPSGTANISIRYLGIPASNIATTAYRTVTNFTATAGQTTFTPPSYTAGYIDVYRNGVKLALADFTATNGTTVVLATGATAGDVIETDSFYVSSVLNAIPAVAGAVTGTYIQTGATIQSPVLASPTINTPTMGGSVITSGTTQATTSGTSVTFTGIPSWAKRITVLFNQVSGNGTSSYLVRLGSGSVQTTGYLSSSAFINTSNAVSCTLDTTGFTVYNGSSANKISGAMSIFNMGSNLWVASHSVGDNDSSKMGGGTVTLSGAPDRVVITFTNGTDTFDLGSVNIQYE